MSRADTHTPSADPNDNLTTLLSTSVLVQLIAVASHNDNDNNNILVALFSSNRQSCCMAGIMFGSLPYSVFCSFPPQFCMHATTPPISFGEFIRLCGQLMSFLLLDLIRDVHHDGGGCSRCRERCLSREREERSVCVDVVDGLACLRGSEVEIYSLSRTSDPSPHLHAKSLLVSGRSEPRDKPFRLPSNLSHSRVTSCNLISTQLRRFRRVPLFALQSFSASFLNVSVIYIL